MKFRQPPKRLYPWHLLFKTEFPPANSSVNASEGISSVSAPSSEGNKAALGQPRGGLRRLHTALIDLRAPVPPGGTCFNAEEGKKPDAAAGGSVPSSGCRREAAPWRLRGRPGPTRAARQEGGSRMMKPGGGFQQQRRRQQQAAGEEPGGRLWLPGTAQSRLFLPTPQRGRRLSPAHGNSAASQCVVSGPCLEAMSAFLSSV